jgi:phosphoribosyl-ATP pyrophosphohydrolase
MERKMEVRTDISEKQAIILLREAVDLIDAANAKIQKVYEASDNLYALHVALEDISAELEMEADELQSIG